MVLVAIGIGMLAVCGGCRGHQSPVVAPVADTPAVTAATVAPVPVQAPAAPVAEALPTTELARIHQVLKEKDAEIAKLKIRIAGLEATRTEANDDPDTESVTDSEPSTDSVGSDASVSEQTQASSVPASPSSILIGKWVSGSEVMEFHPDGTEYDYQGDTPDKRVTYRWSFDGNILRNNMILNGTPTASVEWECHLAPDGQSFEYGNTTETSARETNYGISPPPDQIFTRVN
jgi:hypothetical protein